MPSTRVGARWYSDLLKGTHVLAGSIVILNLHHIMIYDVGGEVGKEGIQDATGAPPKALNQPEGIREVYMEEVIPELGFWGWIREGSRRKGEGGLFIQGEGYKR